MTEPAPLHAVVLGSVHMDLIATASRLPRPGESVTGGTFTMSPGGKAGNQACQLARLGVRTSVISRLGDDVFGQYLLGSLEQSGVETRDVVIDPDAATGASTVLAGDGDYQSIIAPGAANEVTEEQVESAIARLAPPAAFITQFELPLSRTVPAVHRASKAGLFVVVNASPRLESADAIPDSLWSGVDCLVVNRVEAEPLAAMNIATIGDALFAVEELRRRLGVKVALVTAGSNGVVAAAEDVAFHQPALPATLVDTVGAGDAFLGAFVAAHLRGAGIRRAVLEGAAAGALATGRRGAFDALPDLDAITRLIDQHALT